MLIDSVRVGKDGSVAGGERGVAEKDKEVGTQGGGVGTEEEERDGKNTAAERDARGWPGIFLMGGGWVGDVKEKNREKAGRVSWERTGGGGGLGEEGVRGSWERKGVRRFRQSVHPKCPVRLLGH